MTTISGPVVIIGGGIIGCSLAFHLAHYGMTDVTVLEAGLVGDGSTAKATGGIRQQFSSEINADLAREAVDYFAHFADRVGEPFDFRQHGYLFLLKSAEQRAQFERTVAMQQRLGIDTRLVEPDDIGQLVPCINAADLRGAAYCPTDGSGSPADAVAAFARQARRLGVRIEQHTRALEVRRAGGGAVTDVVTADRTYPARTVVNAAGPWARRVGALVGLDLPVQPRPRQAFGIGPLPRLTPDLPLTVDLATGAYVHPEAHGGIVGGNDRDTPASEEATVRWELAEGVINALVHRIPWLADAEIRGGWCGLREMTPDDHAIVGPCEVPGWWNLVGFSGHGFMQAPVIGDHVARWMLGRGDARDLSALRLGRFTEGALAPEAAVF
ncbi:MAG: FAD-binding oxidoreductase [Pseudonocardia sp.]|nr:FAD-binding oxidoreductase [Pseudonocardia sp.]